MARGWGAKLRDAFRGIGLAIWSERSFWVHVPMATAVAAAGLAFRVSLVEGCILGLCVTLVLALEAVNTALEFLSREITREHREGIAAALDMASGAVLIGSLGAAAVGGAIFLNRLAWLP